MFEHKSSQATQLLKKAACSAVMGGSLIGFSFRSQAQEVDPKVLPHQPAEGAAEVQKNVQKNLLSPNIDLALAETRTFINENLVPGISPEQLQNTAAQCTARLIELHERAYERPADPPHKAAFYTAHEAFAKAMKQFVRNECSPECRIMALSMMADAKTQITIHTYENREARLKPLADFYKQYITTLEDPKLATSPAEFSSALGGLLSFVGTIQSLSYSKKDPGVRELLVTDFPRFMRAAVLQFERLSKDATVPTVQVEQQRRRLAGHCLTLSKQLSDSYFGFDETTPLYKAVNGIYQENLKNGGAFTSPQAIQELYASQEISLRDITKYLIAENKASFHEALAVVIKNTARAVANCKSKADVEEALKPLSGLIPRDNRLASPYALEAGQIIASSTNPRVHENLYGSLQYLPPCIEGVELLRRGLAQESDHSAVHNGISAALSSAVLQSYSNLPFPERSKFISSLLDDLGVASHVEHAFFGESQSRADTLAKDTLYQKHKPAFEASLQLARESARICLRNRSDQYFHPEGLQLGESFDSHGGLVQREGRAEALRLITNCQTATARLAYHIGVLCDSGLSEQQLNVVADIFFLDFAWRRSFTLDGNEVINSENEANFAIDELAYLRKPLVSQLEQAVPEQILDAKEKVRLIGNLRALYDTKLYSRAEGEAKVLALRELLSGYGENSFFRQMENRRTFELYEALIAKYAASKKGGVPALSAKQLHALDTLHNDMFREIARKYPDQKPEILREDYDDAALTAIDPALTPAMAEDIKAYLESVSGRVLAHVHKTDVDPLKAEIVGMILRDRGDRGFIDMSTRLRHLEQLGFTREHLEFLGYGQEQIAKIYESERKVN